MKSPAEAGLFSLDPGLSPGMTTLWSMASRRHFFLVLESFAGAMAVSCLAMIWSLISS
jgi:hypothetical protein